MSNQSRQNTSWIEKTFLAQASLIAITSGVVHLLWPSSAETQLVGSFLINFSRSADGVSIIYFALLFSSVNFHLWAMLSQAALSGAVGRGDLGKIERPVFGTTGALIVILLLKINLYAALYLFAAHARPIQVHLFVIIFAIHLLGGTALLIPINYLKHNRTTVNQAD